MYYTIYKITNLVNGKIYIGKHQTKNLDDSYMGSSNLLRSAINKYGRENFRKEILFCFDTEDEMNAMEAELVNEEFCNSEDTYNLCPGGKGGWGYVNKMGLDPARGAKAGHKKYGKNQPGLIALRAYHSSDNKNRVLSFLGKTHTDETKALMSKRHKERLSDKTRNSQFGTMWITNGNENRKIQKADEIPNGWYKGRVNGNRKISIF